MHEKPYKSPLALPKSVRRAWRTTRLEYILEWLDSGGTNEKVSRIAGIVILAGLLLAYLCPEPVGAVGMAVLLVTISATIVFLTSKTWGWLSGRVQFFDTLVYWALFATVIVLMVATPSR